MTLRGRLFVFVTLLIVTSISGTAAVFIYSYWESALERTQNSGILLARLLGQSIGFSRQTPVAFERMLDEAALTQADVIAHLIQIAQKQPARPQEINRSLQQVAARENIAEIWVTDRQGLPKYWSLPDLDINLGRENAVTQLPVFRPLLEGRKYSLVTDTMRQDSQGRELYYIALTMPDRSGMVLVSRQPPNQSSEGSNNIGLKRMLETVISGNLSSTSIDTIRVFDDNLKLQVFSSIKGVNQQTALTAEERQLLSEVLNASVPATYLESRSLGEALLGYAQLQVAGPIMGMDGLPDGLILVNLSIDMSSIIRYQLALAGGLTVTLLVLWLLLALFFLNRAVQPLARLTVQTHRLIERNFAADAAMEAELLGISSGRRDEVAYLSGALRSMIATLNSYIANLKETTAAKERIEGELAAARSIQLGLLPNNFTLAADCDLYALLESAKAVGGDLFDFFMLDEHRLFFMIGDVSDKGVPASLFMAVTKTLFTVEAQRDSSSTSGIMERVNNALAQNNPEGMFVTVFIGILDTRTGLITASDGGHDAPLVLRASGVEVVKKKGGMALGLFPDVLYPQWHIQLAPHEGLVIYTDGVSEAMNADYQMFGSERLLATLHECAVQHPAPAVAEQVMQAVRIFVGTHPQSDDITLLVLRWAPAPLPSPLPVIQSSALDAESHRET